MVVGNGRCSIALLAYTRVYRFQETLRKSRMCVSQAFWGPWYIVLSIQLLINVSLSPKKMMQDQLLSCTIVSKGIKKKTIIPKNHSVKITQKEANIFSSTTWSDLSKNERETRPPPAPKPEPGPVPFFEQPGESASLTLEQLVYKDCIGKWMYTVVYILFIEMLT